MKTDPITLAFDSDFKGTLTSPTGVVTLGDQPGGVQPYHLLYGALGSCFYATFLGIAKKKRLTFTTATIEITGTKRDQIPPTLEVVNLHLTIIGGEDHDQFIKAAELGAKHCSIHETIKQVATIHLIVDFVDPN